MEFEDKKVEEILFGVSIPNLISKIKSAIILIGDEEYIEQEHLDIILRYEIPILRATDYKPLTKDEIYAIREEFLLQDFLRNRLSKNSLLYEIGPRGNKIFN